MAVPVTATLGLMLAIPYIVAHSLVPALLVPAGEDPATSELAILVQVEPQFRGSTEKKT